MKAITTGVLAAFILTLPACAATREPAEFTVIKSWTGTQVAVGACANKPVDDIKPKDDGTEEKTLPIALLTGLATKGVSLLGSALSKAAAEKTWNATASRNFEVSDQFPRCIQVARGTFATGPAATSSWTLGGWLPNTSQVLAANGLRLTAAPDFLFEAQLISASGGGNFKIRPLMASFARPIGSRTFRADDERSIAVFFAISEPNVKPTLSNNPGATVLIGAMKPFTTQPFDDPSSLPAGVASAYESSWFTLKNGKQWTISVLVTETQGEDKFLNFIASVFSDKAVQDEATILAKSAIVPGFAEQAETQADIDKAKLIAARKEKYDAAVAKLDVCRKAANPGAEVSAAVNALTAYLEADGKVTPHQALTSVSKIKTLADAKGADVVKQCEAAYNDIYK